MKDYFNAEERTKHIILMSCAHIAKTLSNSPALTEAEKRSLKCVANNMDKFNDSIFSRFGEAYRRKLEGVMKCNKLSLVGKYEKAIEAVDQCVVDDMMLMIDKFRSWECLTCEREDYNKCFIYNACLTCNVDVSNEGGCPFKL